MNKILGIGVLIAIVVVILAIESSKPDQSSLAAQDVELDANVRTEQKLQEYDVAKEITTPDGFINSPTPGIDENEPFALADYIGEKVILVEFWTYSCINCQRVIPFLNDWHEKYSDDGLVIVGIHTPEFEFEKDFANVQRAVTNFDVEWPVVLDNDYSTWRAYNNRYWPRKYLIDIDGFIVYDHIGEGAYEETENKIVELLNERRAVLGEDGSIVVEGGGVDADNVDFRKIGTPETYLGSSRVERIQNLPNAECLDGTCTYEFSTRPLVGYELEGEWAATGEYIENLGVGNLRIAFTASKVNLVAGATGAPVRARILLDGEPISADAAGNEVTDGIVEFTTEDLYNLVDLQGSYESRTLEIQFLNGGVQAFAFTFG